MEINSRESLEYQVKDFENIDYLTITKNIFHLG
jgi:hypothetical protein